jgi:hypothetical protein
VVKPFAIVCAASFIAILPGCATTTGSAAIERAAGCTFCDCARPIRWSGRDSDATIAQVREHNAVGRALRCPAFDIAAPPTRPPR